MNLSRRHLLKLGGAGLAGPTRPVVCTETMKARNDPGTTTCLGPNGTEALPPPERSTTTPPLFNATAPPPAAR